MPNAIPGAEPPPYRRPVFVCGMPRSGTTLMQSILCANGPYFPMPETHFFSFAARGLPDSGLGEADHRRIAKRLAKRARIDLDPKDLSDRATRRAVFERLVETFDRDGADTFLEKTPRHAFCHRDIIGAFPDARFVCMVREPRNMVASNIAAFGRGQSLIRLSRLYNRLGRAAQAIGARPEGRMVRYEDLLADPEGTVKDLCGFLDAPFDPKCLVRFSEAAAEAIAPGETWKDNVAASDGVIEDDPDKWRETLDEGEAAVLAFLTGKVARDLEYSITAGFGDALPGLLADLPTLGHPHQWMRLFDPVDG